MAFRVVGYIVDTIEGGGSAERVILSIDMYVRIGWFFF